MSVSKEGWEYTGDCEIRNGGYYVDTTLFETVRKNPRIMFNGVMVIEVVNLESACGFNGAVLIRKGWLSMPEKHRTAALDRIGADPRTRDPQALVDAFLAYSGIQDVHFEIVFVFGTDNPLDHPEFKHPHVHRAAKNRNLRRYIKEYLM